MLQREMGNEFKVLHFQTTDVSMGRNQLLGIAKELNLDYLAMIDSDMTFPPNGIKTLLRTMQKFDAKIGAGLYFVEQDNIFRPSAGVRNGELYEPIKSWREPFLIDACGMGFTIIDKELFDIPFDFADGLGEDYYFCRQARKLGHKIVLEPKIQCGHLRTFQVNEKFIAGLN